MFRANPAISMLIVMVAAALTVASAVVVAEETPAELRILRDVTYVKHGARELKADIYIPRGAGPFPALLMVHGGGWMSGAKWQMVAHARAAAQRGYTAVSIDYRLAPDNKFPAQIEDCKEAVRWMRRNAEKYKIDPHRIAGYGYSAGGHLVCLLGATSAEDGLEGPDADADGPSTRLQAAVAGGAPCGFEWVPLRSKALVYFLGHTREEQPDVYRQASPISFVTKDDPPVFFYHGETDSLVPRSSPEQMLKRLREAGVRAEMHVVANKGHLLAFLDAGAKEEALDFLDDVLK